MIVRIHDFVMLQAPSQARAHTKKAKLEHDQSSSPMSGLA